MDATLDLTPHGSIYVECVTNGPVETNTYFVSSLDECMVIDPASDGERLVADYLAQHPRVSVKGVVCTHAHGDHIGGVAGMRAALGRDLPFCITREDAEFIPQAVESMRSMWGIRTPDPGAPSRLLEEGDVVEFGNAHLQVLLTPGHTPGGAVLFASCENGLFAFVGDTLFPGSHGRTDLVGGDEPTILDSLAKMARVLPSETLCLVGHGRATTMGEETLSNPFLQGA